MFQFLHGLDCRCSGRTLTVAPPLELLKLKPQNLFPDAPRGASLHFFVQIISPDSFKVQQLPLKMFSLRIWPGNGINVASFQKEFQFF